MDINRWRCQMCGDGFKELRKKIIYGGKRYVSIKSKNIKRKNKAIRRLTYRIKLRQKFCSPACAFNYSSWQKKQDDKKNYDKEKFFCQFCGQESDGGQVVYKSEHDTKWQLKRCRKCNRKLLMKKLGKKWDMSHKERRREIARRWRSKNPEKALDAKKKYLTKRGKQYGIKNDFWAGKRWSMYFLQCVLCKTTNNPHHGYGYCRRCYQKKARDGTLLS